METISGEGYNFKGLHRVLDKKELDDTILVVYDYMEYPKNKPAKNLVAYDRKGNLKWLAESPGKPTSAYYAVTSINPLVANSFCSHACTIDPSTGKIVNSEFYK
jgi:hypothetical protein